MRTRPTTSCIGSQRSNAGLYAFDAAWLRRRIALLRPSPITGELYLTDLVGFARVGRAPGGGPRRYDDGRLTGINDGAQLARANRVCGSRRTIAGCVPA